MFPFPKRQRKLSQQRLTDLHQNGSPVFHHPYKVFYLTHPTSAGACSECSIVISVPKRNFKRAVDRNRIKRQIREVFRLNSSVLHFELVAQSMNIDILCLYLPNEHTATSHLFNKMESLLARLSRLVAQAGSISLCGSD